MSRVARSVDALVQVRLSFGEHGTAPYQSPCKPNSTSARSQEDRGLGERDAAFGHTDEVDGLLRSDRDRETVGVG